MNIMAKEKLSKAMRLKMQMEISKTAAKNPEFMKIIQEKIKNQQNLKKD